MATVSITLDRSLEARVSKYADGVGVSLEQVVERALNFALKTRIVAGARPDQSLPGRDRPTDPGYGKPGGGARPDQSLPGEQPEAGQLPANGARRCPVFDASVDNELPEGEIPVEVPDQELPETAEPK
ncbi:MAG: hypothetical protein EHM18_02830 [Acidobacteria bacterium]|nr:MAG: hypothetical protein EHM18_02830 [Acidobacteriota bacterium]